MTDKNEIQAVIFTSEKITILFIIQLAQNNFNFSLFTVFEILIILILVYLQFTQ